MAAGCGGLLDRLGLGVHRRLDDRLRFGDDRDDLSLLEMGHIGGRGRLLSVGGFRFARLRFDRFGWFDRLDRFDRFGRAGTPSRGRPFQVSARTLEGPGGAAAGGCAPLCTVCR
ncbi:hypothetical protein MINTM023_00400 [Mycobacterium intracellulare]|nr:hypothetical protein MINTM023_00400 [Mycobacterium intracellulare]